MENAAPLYGRTHLERGQDLVLRVRLVDDLLPVFPVRLVAVRGVRARARFLATAREVRQTLAKPAGLVKRPRHRVLVVLRARAEASNPLAARGVPGARAGNDDGAAVDRPSRSRARPTTPPCRGGCLAPDGPPAETAERGERRARAPRRRTAWAFGESAEPNACPARGGGKRPDHRPARHRDARYEPGSRFPNTRRTPSRSLRVSLASPCTRARQCGPPAHDTNVYFGDALNDEFQLSSQHALLYPIRRTFRNSRNTSMPNDELVAK